jgi:hypothetical protein
VGWVLIFEKSKSGRRRFWTYAEGNMLPERQREFWAVLRSRRPQCTPRNFLHGNRETSGAPVGAVITERSLRGCSRTLPPGCGVNGKSAGEGFGRKTCG